MLFVIPWGRHWIIGTTDTDWHLDKAHPAATAADIDYLLEHVNKVLAPADPRGRRGRLRRPAPAAGRREARRPPSSRASTWWPTPCPASWWSRAANGPRTGSWPRTRSTRRRASMDGAVPASCTEAIPLLGAEGYKAAWNQRGTGWPRRPACTSRAIEHLLNRYGAMADGGPRARRRQPGAGRAAAGRRRLPRRRGRLRRLARGRPASRGRADPPHPDLDRGVGPRVLGAPVAAS